MNTTDNSTIPESQEENHGQITQAQLDAQDKDELVKAEVGTPISESQVQPGSELVDGKGRRDTEQVDNQRPDILVDKDAVTQSKIDAMTEQDHAKRVEDKERTKLGHSSNKK